MKFIKDKNILITGGAGFIGSHICEFLVKQKDVGIIRILDNLSNGKKENIQFLLDKYDNLEFLWGDITNYTSCQLAVKDINIVCHQAAVGSVPRSISNPMLSHNNNINGTFNMLLAAKEEGIKRFVYASSSSVYGDEPNLPKREDRIGEVLSPYALNKKVGELYAKIFCRCYGMECIGLRYFNVFGPRQDPNGAYAAVIPKFIKLMKEGISPTINGDGSFSRDFTYVDNVVQANWLAMTTQNSKCFGEAFNIGAGGRTSLLELVEAINKGLGKQIKPILGEGRKGDIPHSNADISKAREMLGYRVDIYFSEGIGKLLKYNNKYSSYSHKNIDYNKLLGKTKFTPDYNTLSGLKDKTILVTGGVGSIGSDIVRHLNKVNIKQIIVYDSHECGIFNLKNELNNDNITFILGNILDKSHLENIFLEYNIDYIYHAAAYKHVPILEFNVKEAIQNNIIGTKNVVDLSIKYKSNKFVLVSTDKAVNPTSIMGMTKRICELYIKYSSSNTYTELITTRFGNVIGSSGSVIPTFINHLNRGDNLKLTHKDITRYFMTIPEASYLVLISSLIGKKGQVLIFKMGEPIKIYDIATRLLEQLNIKEQKIDIIGLRPGEKMYEELFYESENLLPTINNKILLLEHNNLSSNFINKFNNLINNYNKLNNEELIFEIKNIIN